MTAETATVQTKYFTISDLARKHNVSLRTLRFYEDKGLLQPLRRGNIRLYTARDDIRVQLIIKGKKFGFSLRCIAELIGSQDHDQQAEQPCIVASLSKEEIKTQIAELQMQRERVEDAIQELQRSMHSKVEAGAMVVAA